MYTPSVPFRSFNSLARRSGAVQARLSLSDTCATPGVGHAVSQIERVSLCGEIGMIARQSSSEPSDACAYRTGEPPLTITQSSLCQTILWSSKSQAKAPFTVGPPGGALSFMLRLRNGSILLVCREITPIRKANFGRQNGHVPSDQIFSKSY